MNMKTLVQRFVAVLGILAVLGIVGINVTPAAQAQQINPTAQSVTQESLFEALQDDQMVGGRVSIPDGLWSGLIKPGNSSWARTHTGLVRTLSISAVVKSSPAIEAPVP